MIANAVLHLLQAPAGVAAAPAGVAAAPAGVAAAPAGVAAAPGGDPVAMDALIDESLRLEPAAAVIDRYATADVKFGGAEIGRGELVRLSLAGANRDPAVFDDPDAFRPERPNLRRHVAFAQGPHVCVGVHLARLEARAALAALLRYLPGLRLDPARPAEIRGLVFRKPPRLDVLWDS
jgi:cytochrome P450